MTDPALNPGHYRNFSNGAEVIDIRENLTSNAGDAVKYLARSSHLDAALHKGSDQQDLGKALWYTAREIHRRFGAQALLDAVTAAMAGAVPLTALEDFPRWTPDNAEDLTRHQ